MQACFPFRTHQIDHTHHFEFMLASNHKLYQRSLDDIHPKKMDRGDLIPISDNDWHLFDSIGIPYKQSFDKILDDGEYVVEFSVAAEVVVVVTNFDRVYIYKPTRKKRPISWSHHIGQPFRRALYLPKERRSWTFSVSIGDKIGEIIDFIHPLDRNYYFQDGNGIAHEFGFTGTIFVLLQDGQRIMYWDTGLSPSFSRGFLSPLNGTTQGQMISATGSTIFISVIDQTGKLRFFTRMLDYEIFGGTPGFHFSYTASTSEAELVDRIIPLGRGVRKLPLPGWKEHDVSSIPPTLLTHHISLELLGAGNENRELRIFGRDSRGNEGYFSKKIFETVWLFNCNPTIDFSLLTQQFWPFNHTTSPPTKNYRGAFLHDDSMALPFQFTLINFHSLLSASEPAYLLIQLGSHHIEVVLHVVDGWNVMSHKEAHHDLIGNVDGHMKSLRGTIILPHTIHSLHVTCPSLYAFIQNFFAPYHAKTNAFTLCANNANVLFQSNDHSIKMIFHRNLSSAELQESYFMKRANNPYLMRTPTNAVEKAEVLLVNKRTLTEIQKFHRHFIHTAFLFLGISVVADGGLKIITPIASIVHKVLGERGKIPIGPMGEQAVQDLKPLFKAQRDVNLQTLIQEPSDYRLAVEILTKRIRRFS